MIDADFDYDLSPFLQLQKSCQVAVKFKVSSVAAVNISTGLAAASSLLEKQIDQRQQNLDMTFHEILAGS